MVYGHHYLLFIDTMSWSSIGVAKESKKKLHGYVAEGQHKKDINVTSFSLHGKMTLVLSNKSLFFISAILAVGFITDRLLTRAVMEEMSS